VNPVPFEMRDPLLSPYHAEGALEPAEIKAKRAYRKRFAKPFIRLLLRLPR
jgi:hypothetical protein